MALTGTYTVSLHDALPIYAGERRQVLAPEAARRRDVERARQGHLVRTGRVPRGLDVREADRKSTRLNSSHTVISYAVFCLKQKTRSTAHTLRRPPRRRSHR